MKVLLSPAKSLDLDSQLPTQKATTPVFDNEVKTLVNVLQDRSKNDLASLMSISDKLATLNHERFQDFDTDMNSDKARPAIFTFNGDVYDGFDAFSLSADHFSYMQDSLRILSGLYGVLRPLDKIQAYRLEMGTQLKVGKAKNLYEFWQDKITEHLKDELAKDEVLVNLASQEYARSVDLMAFDQKVVQPQFKDFKNGKLKTIPFYAKKARGMMARFIVDQKVNNVDQLKDFNYGDYTFSNQHTEQENKPMFIR